MPFKVNSEQFAAGRGLGLRTSVLFERGKNRDYRVWYIGLILLVCVKVQFGMSDTTMINGS